MVATSSGLLVSEAAKNVLRLDRLRKDLPFLFAFSVIQMKSSQIESNGLEPSIHNSISEATRKGIHTYTDSTAASMIMKFLFAAVLFSGFYAVHGNELVNFQQRCLSADEVDYTQDYFPSKYLPLNYVPPNADSFLDKFDQDTTTDLFSISYHNYYKIITNHFVNKTYLLHLCGTEPPASELDGRHHLVLPIPHKGGLAITQTTQIPYLELLGLRREVIAYIGDPQWVSSPCMRHQMDVEQSLEIFFDSEDPYNSSKTDQLTDQFLSEHPDALVVTGPYGNANADRTILAAETQERTNVATFDWIGYYAAFYNLEGLSNQIAAETKASYDCSSSNAASISADRPAEEKPVVLWADYFHGYNWSVAECPTWDHTYYCEYAMHCGATILSRPEGVGWNDPDFGGRYWYLNDQELLEVSLKLCLDVVQYHKVFPPFPHQ